MRTILVVDDEPALREALTLALEAEFRIESAADIAGAEQALRDLAVDLILLDERLPGLHGTAWLAQRRGTRLPPVVLLSAQADVELGLKALRLGARDCLCKPVDLGALRERLSAVLGTLGGEAPSTPFALKAARTWRQVREETGLEPLQASTDSLKDRLLATALGHCGGDRKGAAWRLDVTEEEFEALWLSRSALH